MNDDSSFLWHLCRNVIMCKYLQAPNRNPENLRSLCNTLWEYRFQCTKIKLCLGGRIMLFKRYNIPSIWLRACTELSLLLILCLSLFSIMYNVVFFSHSSCHSTPYMQIHKCSSLYEMAFVAVSYCSQIDKSACLKREPSRTMFYPKKKLW